MKIKILIIFLFVSLLSIANNNVTEIYKLYKKVDSLYNYKKFDESLTLCKQLEKKSKKIKNDTLLLKAYTIQAKIYYKKKAYTKSIRYFEKSLNLREKLHLTKDLGPSYYNLGSTCLKLKKTTKAKVYFTKALKIAQKDKDKDLLYACHNALYATNLKLMNYKSALKSLEYVRNAEVGEQFKKIELYQKQYKQVQKEKEKITTEKILTEKKLHKAKNVIDTISSDLEESKEEINKLTEDTLRKRLRINSLNFQKTLNEYNLKLKQEALKAKQSELKRQKQITIIFIIGLIIVLALAFVLYKIYLSKKRMNKLLIKQQSQINKSINYASKIQTAVLPDKNNFKEYFAEYFIIYKPRDIVSGDFYFLHKVNKYIILAAADCTGHGVPGAFMSMLGVAFLNDIVRQKNVETASDVLNVLRENVKESLKQKGEKGEQKDGMDMALCVIDTETNNLQFAGAHNPLIIVRNNKLIEIKADRMPVGVLRKKDKPFKNNEIKLEKGDKLYMYSDGFADQIGGENKEKYKSKRFKKLLLETSNMSMFEQKQTIETEFEQWKGTNKQIDDVVIIAVKI